MPRWRNWQTRQLEVLVGLISRGGSSPLLGIQRPASHEAGRSSCPKRIKNGADLKGPPRI